MLKISKGLIFIIVTIFITQIPAQELFIYNESNSPLIVDDMYSLAVDSSNNIWIGSGTGAFNFNNETWSIVDTNLNIAPPFTNTQFVSDVEVSPNGNVWMVVMNWLYTEPNNLYKIAGSELTGYNLGYIGLRNSSNISLADDSTIVMVLSNYWQQGSNYLDAVGLKRGGEFNIVGEFWGLKSATLLNNDTTILATMESNIFLFENNVWNDITPITWNEFDTYNLYQYKNKNYLYGHRFIDFALGAFIEYSEIDSLLEAENTQITTVGSVNENLFWIGTKSGLLIKYNNGIINIYDNLEGNEIRELAIDRDGNIWIIVNEIGCVVFNESQIVNIEKTESVLPKGFVLYQNYPNPFNPTTKIKFTVPVADAFHASQRTLLKIYDILGNEITTLVDELKRPGTYEVAFDGTGLVSGIYFYKLDVGKYSEIKKMLLMK